MQSVVTALSRLAMLVIVFAPLVFAPQRTIAVVLVALFVKNILVAVNNCAWQSWMKDLVPGEGLGAFHPKRYSRTTAAAAVTSLAEESFINDWETNLPEPSFRSERGRRCAKSRRALAPGISSQRRAANIPPRPAPAVKAGAGRLSPANTR